MSFEKTNLNNEVGRKLEIDEDFKKYYEEIDGNKKDKVQIFVSGSSKKEYQINLTKEEIEAIPIILNMAMVYTWELYNNKEGDKFYKQHKENIDMIKEYHNKGYQGILAVGDFIETKSKLAIEDKKINDVLEPYINKNS